MKIAVDANVLVRLMTLDDEPRVRQAIALVESYGPRDIFICHGVLIETYFVLRKKYMFTMENALGSFERLLSVPQFYFEYEPAVWQAISKAAKGYHFSDALIGEIGASRSLKTHTFDLGLKDNKNFEMIR